MNKLSNVALVLSALSLLVGCAGTASPDAPESSSQAVHASDPAPDLTGTWVFELEKSDVAEAVRADCSSKPNPKACWSEIAEEAKVEKIRFAPGADGHVEWSSFAATPKGEMLFVALPVDLQSDGPGHVLAKVAGSPKGPHGDQFVKANITQLRIETLGAKTIVMNDPKKGRLVYSKE